MSGPQKATRTGLDLGMAAIRHTGWWLRWQTDRHACREAAVLAAPPADAPTSGEC